MKLITVMFYGREVSGSILTVRLSFSHPICEDKSVKQVHFGFFNTFYHV